MNALSSHAPSLTPPSGRVAISLDELAMCVRALDPGSRALLDLSLRRRLPFEAMAGFLQTDPFDLARRRARAVARIAAELDLEGSGVVATVKAALARLPDDAWGVPLPARPPAPVQADAMAAAARALMTRLREQRQQARQATAGVADRSEQPTVEMEAVVTEPVATELAELEAAAGDEAVITQRGRACDPEVVDGEVLADAADAAEAAAEPPPADAVSDDQATVESAALSREDIDAAEQPTVESDAVQPWSPAPPPLAATDMAAAFSHHPAFAVEATDASALPPLAEALARAAARERASAPEDAGASAPPQPNLAPSPASEPDRPVAPLAVPPAAARAPRRLARGGLLLGVLLAIVRFLLRRH